MISRWLVASLALSSCVSPQRAVRPTDLTVDLFLGDQATRRKLFEAVGGKIFVRLLGEKESISGGGRIKARTDRPCVRLELRDPVGRSQYQAILNQGTFFSVYPQQKRVVEDLSGGTLFFSRLGIPMRFTDLTALSVGLIPTYWKLDRATWTWAGHVYQVAASDQHAEYTIAVDAVTGAASRVALKGGWELVYGDFERFNSVTFAYNAVFRMDQRVLEFLWDNSPDVGVAIDSETCTFKTPSGYDLESIGHRK